MTDDLRERVEAYTTAFGPKEATYFDAKSWAQLHATLTEVLAHPERLAKGAEGALTDFESCATAYEIPSHGHERANAMRWFMLGEKHSAALRALPAAPALAQGEPVAWPTQNELSAARWIVTQVHRRKEWDKGDLDRLFEALHAVIRAGDSPCRSEPAAYLETITGRVCAPDDEHRLKFPMGYRPLFTAPATKEPGK